MIKMAIEKTIAGLSALLICAKVAIAAEPHPIVEVERAYLFGAIVDGKWIKADEAAKAIADILQSIKERRA